VAHKPRLDEATEGKLLLVLLAFCWGLSWPALRIALDEISPWTTRLLGYCIGTAALIVLLRLQGRRFAIPYGRDWLHVIVAGMLNVVAFGLFGTFAQLGATTSRVIIINYSMPIWASLMAWFILGERLNAWVSVGLALCIAGLAVLVYPIVGVSMRDPTGLVLAFFCSLSWAAGTIYIKAVRIEGDLLAIVMWQIVVGVVVFFFGMLIFQGPPSFEPLQLRTWLGVAYSGLFGTALAYFIWYNIIGKVSTATASLGTLANPVVGIIGSVLLLGERLTAADIVGFALIFAAAACVLLQPREQSLPAQKDTGEPG
jgi:drug/metabolite transporter (DMT)-like permease